MATLIYDTEIYKNYFLAMFLDIGTNKVAMFEM